MSKNSYSLIKKELDRWFARSRQMRTSAGISYGKIKSHMTVYESTATKEEISSLQVESGKLI